MSSWCRIQESCEVFVCSFHQIGHNSLLGSRKAALFVACESRLPEASNHVYYVHISITGWAAHKREVANHHLLHVTLLCWSSKYWSSSLRPYIRIKLQRTIISIKNGNAKACLKCFSTEKCYWLKGTCRQISLHAFAEKEQWRKRLITVSSSAEAQRTHE